MEHIKEFEKLIEEFSRLQYIKPSSLPGIDLYMDQVTTFMDEKLAHAKRYPDDKILTKTMINNYTKNALLPPTEKKKYTKEHMLLLIYIYYLKNILPINDIQTLLAPLEEHYFGQNGDFGLSDIYREVVSMETQMFRPFYKDILRKVEKAEQTFTDRPEDEQEYLQIFSMVCMLAFDVYLKKQMIETIVDDLREKENEAAAEKKRAAKETLKKETVKKNS